MSNTMSSSSELEQFYDQAMDHGFSDPMAVTTSVTNSTTVSPNSSSVTNGQLTPKGVSKPIRRRSRASKKTPTTLLNANTNNFRALVQQFTGCPSASISFRNQRGPVNLDFGKEREENQSVVTSVMGPFGNNYYYQHQQSQSPQHHLHQQFQQQQLVPLQEQQSMYSFGNIGNDVFATSSNNPRLNMEGVNGFALEDNVNFFA
ncbi:VQ motif-containing protein 22 [Quercus suber]|uniref:Vq motif-containing protein 22 n=1 Tax=Quercus suber TaxID=58331 RepID=A0AAW0MBU2_QUESU